MKYEDDFSRRALLRLICCHLNRNNFYRMCTVSTQISKLTLIVSNSRVCVNNKSTIHEVRVPILDTFKVDTILRGSDTNPRR